MGNQVNQENSTDKSGEFLQIQQIKPRVLILGSSKSTLTETSQLSLCANVNYPRMASLRIKGTFIFIRISLGMVSHENLTKIGFNKQNTFISVSST